MSHPKPAFTKTELHTSHLLLREARTADAADLFQVMSDDLTMRYWSSKAHETVGETAAWLADKMISSHKFNGVTDFLIVLHSSASESVNIARPAVVGKIGCWDGQEIGVLLHRSYWGQGYASEAVAALLEHMWQSTDMQTVTADVDPRNDASLRLLKRFGFEVEREERNTMETHIGWCDSTYLRLKRPAASN